jgi:hypothetical protein
MQTQLIEQLKSLRLRGMANALEERLTALSQKKLAPTGAALCAPAARPPSSRRADRGPPVLGSGGLRIWLRQTSPLWVAFATRRRRC